MQVLRANALALRVTPLFVLYVWLTVIFMAGGGSRSDIVSLLVLRPLGIIMVFASLWFLKRENWPKANLVVLSILAVLTLAVVQLIPLPPELWHSLPQRDLIVRIDAAAGLTDAWRPLSIAPDRTANVMYFLFAPLSVALLLLGMEPSERTNLIKLVVGFGLFSGVLGVLQLTSSDSSPLYFYSIHTPNAAVGLFANRNHQAAFLALCIPLTAAFASGTFRSEQRKRVIQFVALLIIAFLAALLLVVGSRLGVISGVIALAVLPFIWSDALLSQTSALKKPAFRTGAIIGIVTVPILLTIVFARSQAIDRLLGSDDVEEYRLRTFEPVLNLMYDYFPFGSGLGSFVEAYSRVEPDALLEPRYLNHAHFDFLEWAITAGLPAMLGIAFAAGLFAIGTFKLFLRYDKAWPNVRTGRAASVGLAILAIGSVVDYPLRTPILISVSVLLSYWMLDALASSSAKQRQSNRWRSGNA